MAKRSRTDSAQGSVPSSMPMRVRAVIQALHSHEFFKRKAEETQARSRRSGDLIEGSAAAALMLEGSKYAFQAAKELSSIDAISGVPGLRTACLKLSGAFDVVTINRVCAVAADAQGLTVDEVFDLPVEEAVRYLSSDEALPTGTKESKPPAPKLGDDEPLDPIEEALTGQPLAIYKFLRERKRWTQYDALATEEVLWRKGTADDDTIFRALRRLRELLNELGTVTTLMVEQQSRRTRLDKPGP